MTHSPPPAMPGRSHAPPPTSGVPALRDRSRAMADQMGRRDQQSQPQTVRELVRVFDDGALPTQPNLVYHTHPVEIDADDVEGATPTFTPDTNQTIPVVFIRNAPQAGDMAVASAVAGRWVAEVGGAKGKFCLVDCNGVPVAGDTVTVSTYPEGATVGHCTSGAGGCCTIGGLQSDPRYYRVVVTDPGGKTVSDQIAIFGPDGTRTTNTTSCPVVTVILCGNVPPPPGCPVTARFYCDGVMTFEGQADANGTVTAVLPANCANPTVELVNLPPGYDTSVAYPLASGGNVVTTSAGHFTIYPATLPGFMCCPVDAIVMDGYQALLPLNMTLTDANGSHAFDWCQEYSQGSPVPLPNGWYCCYTTTKSPVADCAAIPPTENGTDTIAIFYSGNCTSDPNTGKIVFQVTRNWLSVNDNNVVKNYAKGSCGAAYGCPNPFSPCDATAGHGNDWSYANFPLDIGPCGAFAASGALTPTTDNIMPDPVGGTIALS